MKIQKLLLFSIFALFPVAHAEQKRIYIANDDHTDYMWSADADTYNQVFVDLLDFHLKLADETTGNPSPYRARFNTDGSYWLWNYEKKKSPAEFERLIGRIKDGSISSPLNTLVSCYGAQPAEAVLRGLYYAGRIERRYDLRFTLANATENQVLPLGLASLFAGSGAEYTWRGVCGCASRIPNKVLMKRDKEIYWYTGHDDQRLLMKWYSMGPHSIGTYTEAMNPMNSINFLTTSADFLKRYTNPVTQEPYNILGIFGYGGDDLARRTGVTPPPEIPRVPGLPNVQSSPYCDHFHVIAQNNSNAERQIISSNEHDFFKDFDKTYGAHLPHDTVTYGNEWDLYSASMSETSARVKRSVEKLRSSELLAAYVSLKYPRFMHNHVGARDDAFKDLGLYWEHNWTADGPVSRPHRAAWQEKLAANIEYYVDSLYAEGLIRLGGMIPRPNESVKRFFVLNPLGWSRTDYADFPYNDAHDIHVYDLAAEKDVPHQLVRDKGIQHLRILASDIPSAGYKVFEIRAGKGSAPTDDAAKVSNESTIENDAVKLVVERDGAIRSFIDKKRGNTELAGNVFDLKLNDFAEKSDEGDALRVENSGPVSVTLRARSDAGKEHSSSITLYRNSDRVDISNEITTNFSDTRYWAFTFALQNPSAHSEEVGAVNLNKLKSEGGDYANSHARYDHITVNHFADISDGNGKKGVTLSNPDLAFGRLGYSEANVLDTTTPQIHMLAGGQVDGPPLGIRAQNNNSQFLQRFALRAHEGYDQAAAMKFALEHQNPFVTGAIISKQGGVYPEKEFSLLTVSNPEVLLWALKVPEDGIEKGLIVRVWNQAKESEKTRFSSPVPISLARRTTHIETPLENLPVVDGTLEAIIGKQRMETFNLEMIQP